VLLCVGVPVCACVCVGVQGRLCMFSVAVVYLVRMLVGGCVNNLAF
jgi:hypothetical protein